MPRIASGTKTSASQAASSAKAGSGSSKRAKTDSSADKENRNGLEDDAASSGDAVAEVERLSKRLRRLEEDLEDMEAERDAAVKQFETLQVLRQTKVEQQLERVKEKAMEKHQLQEKLISTLKDRVKSVENTNEALKANGYNIATGSTTTFEAVPSSRMEDDSETAAELKKLKDEMTRKERDWKLERSSLQDQVRQLERENKAEREASKAALQKARGPHAAASESGPSHGAGNEDAEKVRALYEDLTGLTISSVETYDPRQGHRRFRGVFASQGFHHLQLCLEESTSDISSNGDKASSTSRSKPPAPRKRHDLVYIPQVQEDRDAELISAGTLPAYFLGQIRFERSSGVKFFDKLHRGLERK
ncbi:hypothetical protein OC861_005522 [Tilletia horrida]|nr:hypothetical protein OC861_005522 [Tilletia horrida]